MRGVAASPQNGLIDFAPPDQVLMSSTCYFGCNTRLHSDFVLAVLPHCLAQVPSMPQSFQDERSEKRLCLAPKQQTAMYFFVGRSLQFMPT